MSQPLARAADDTWERRLDVLYRVVPYPMLVISAGFAALLVNAGFKSWAAFDASVALAVVAAAWTLLMSTLRSDADTRPVYFLGRTALAGVLVALNPWYALYGFVGYLDAWRVLPRRWSIYGVVATAYIMAASQMGGYPPLDAGSIATYIALGAVNGALAGIFGVIGQRTIEQNREHRGLIADLAATNRNLEVALAENTGLHAQLVAQAREAGILDERQRLAGEIHDTLAQGLTGIVTQLEAAEQAHQSPERWRRHFEQARALARDSLVQARRSVRALRPEQLESTGLVDAIAGLAIGWSRTSGVEPCVETTGDPRPLPAEVEAALFRVAQEALTNVAKHAQATKVWLTLSYLDDVVLLDVRDDGVGFDAAGTRVASPSGFGLDAMRQRLQRVAGTLEVESTAGEGTALSACVPVAVASVLR